MGFLKSQRHKNRPKTIEIEGVKITKNNAKTTYHQSLDSSPCPLWLVLVLALARLPLLFLFFLPSTAALYPAIPLFIVKSINMTANDPQKIYKTSGIFFVFVAVTVLFAWAQYAVPLEHVSTQERLQASKQAYTSKRNNENRQRQGQKSAQTSSKQQDAGEPWQSSLQSTETQNRPDYHVVFSTSCSEQQNWESYVFFYHAMKVKQPGNVTRIASACTAKESKEQTDFFNKYIHPMNPGNFHLHLTPDYGKVALAHGHYYKYMNKRESCGTGTRCLNGSVLVYGFSICVLLLDPCCCCCCCCCTHSLWSPSLDGTRTRDESGYYGTCSQARRRWYCYFDGPRYDFIATHYTWLFRCGQSPVGRGEDNSRHACCTPWFSHGTTGWLSC